MLSVDQIPEFNQIGRSCYIQYYTEKLEMAKKLGYKNVAASYVGEYLKHGSSRRAAKVLGITQAALVHRLHQIPGMVLKSKGGNNQPEITIRKLRVGKCPVRYCNGDRGRKTILKKQRDGKLKCPKCGGIWDDPVEDKNAG